MLFKLILYIYAIGGMYLLPPIALLTLIVYGLRNSTTALALLVTYLIAWSCVLWIPKTNRTHNLSTLNAIVNYDKESSD